MFFVNIIWFFKKYGKRNVRKHKIHKEIVRS